jgi:predicted PurR-regulated permease PerM
LRSTGMASRLFGEIQGFRANPTLKAFTIRCAIATALVASVALVCYSINVLVLVFGSIVVAVALRSMTRIAMRHLPIKERWALALVVTALLVVVIGLGALIGAHLAKQFDQLVQTLEMAWSQAHVALEKSELGRTVLNAESASAAANSATRLAVVATSSLGAVTTLALILLVGLFLAAEPDLYRRGVLRLMPRAARTTVIRLFDALGASLAGWLRGTVIAMLAVGTLTSLGLSLLGVPLALSLGILAGVLEFVPYLGPIVSSVPAILVAFTMGPTRAFEVGALYLAVHAIEAYLLVPVIQKRAVALPPALGLIAGAVRLAVGAHGRGICSSIDGLGHGVDPTTLRRARSGGVLMQTSGGGSRDHRLL